MYGRDTVYIVGHGRTGNDNAITSNFKVFFIGFVIDTRNHEIVDLECTATIEITNRFIRSIFSGQKFDEYNEEIAEEINRRYFGSSQKAIIIAYKDALKRYQEVRKLLQS